MKRTLSVSRPRIIRLLPILVLPLFVAACGTFPLSGGTYPPAGKTKDQQQLDLLTCQDQAKLAANTTARQTGAFLLGLTIIGAPVAFELEKAKQREVFADCMTARGYTVMPVDGTQKETAASKPGTPASNAADNVAKKYEAKPEHEATAPNQRSFAQEVLTGLRLGARASAGAFSDEVYAEQHGLPPPRRMKPQQTHCRPDYNGGFNCVTREQ